VTITSIKDHTVTPSALAEPDTPDMPGGVEVTVMATAGHSQVSSSLSYLAPLSVVNVTVRGS
jgi:hypothetical protein